MMQWILVLVALVVLTGVILAVGAVRRLLVTPLILRWFKRVLPPMSVTEREAIDAGDTWFEAELFQGKPNWEKFLSNPKPTLTKQEQDFLDNEVETLCKMLDDWKITHNDYDISEQAWNYLKTAGFFGMHIPPEFGGLGFSSLASSTVVQKVATKSPTAAVIVMVPNSLGPGELLVNYGTEDQKKHYLHNLAKGVEVPCFGLTSPVAGSDAGAITDEAIVTHGTFNGKNVLGLRLNWDKRYITLAPVATVIGLAVKARDPEHLLGEEVDLGVTVVLIPTNLPGIDIGKRHFPLNQPFMNGPTRGKDVFVPLEYIIGGVERIGHGWQMLVECLAAGRGISLPAVSTATGKHCFGTCGAYAKVRNQFGISIGKFEGVGSVLARIGSYTYMLEATRVLTLGAIDQKFRPSVVTAIAKYHMTEMARIVINDAMDIHGGRGIMLGPHNYLGRTYQASPIGITVEGANILTRCLIIFGQGAIRCHPYVLKEMYAAMDTDPHRSLIEFDDAFAGHMGYTIANFIKLKLHSLTGLMFCAAPDHDRAWSKYYKRLSFFSLALACCADMAMLCLGGNLKRKENLSARLGDILSYLYIASAVLKYNYDHGNQPEEKPYVKWALKYCLFNIQTAFQGFLLNFPVKVFSKPLQWIIFFYWRKYRLPKDDLALQISKHMMQNSPLRDRFMQNCIPVAPLEQTWRKMLDVEPILNLIDQAVKNGVIAKSVEKSDRISAAISQKVITGQEAELASEFAKMQLDVLQVDEFTQAELTGRKND